MDIIAIISQYLHANRRLVVPTFGVFVVKESGGVLFSDLIKTDDGVLRSLLAEQGLEGLAAAGAIDHFIFDARYALDEEGHFDMGALGTLVKGADGVVRLVQHASAPQQTATPQTATQPTTAQQQPTQPTANRNTATERRAQKQPKRRRGVDWSMIVAVVVLLAAIAVVGYAYYCSTEQAEADDAMMEELRFRTEQPATTDK